MPGAIATAYVDVRGDTSKFEQDVDRGAGGALGKLGATVAAGVAALGAGSILKFGVDTAAQLEMTQVGFEGLLGSADEAQKMMDDLSRFAATTPFELPGLADMSRNLLAVGGGFGDLNAVLGRTDSAAGITTDNLLDVTTIVGDLASTLGGGQTQMDAVVRAMGQMSGLGRVTAGDMNQIANALPGFNAWTAVAESMGLTVAEVRAMSEAGELAAEDAIPALLQGMRDFPGAAGAMKRSSETLTGVLSTFKDTAAIALAEGLEPLIKGLKENLASEAILGPLQESFSQFGEVAASGFEAILPAVTTVLGFLPNILDDVGRIFESIAPVIEPVVRLIATFASVLSEGLAVAFEALAPVIEVVGDFIGDIARLVGRTLLPIIEDLTPVLEDLGEMFAEVLGEALPIVMELLEALAPILGEIGGIIGDVILAVLPPVADAFKLIFNALRPLIPILSGALMRIFQALRPVLPVLANALAQVAVSLAEILVALTPLLIPLADLVATLIEELGVPILLGIADAIVMIADSFAELAPLVTTLVEGPLTDVINWVIDFVRESPIVQRIIDGIIGYFQDFANLVGSTIDTIQALFSGDWGAAWESFKILASDALEVFLGLWDDLGPLVLSALNTLWTNFIFPFLQDLPGLMLTGLANLGDVFLQAVQAGGETILNAGQWVVDKMLEALPGIADWFKGLPLRIIQALGFVGEQMLNAGQWVVDKIAEALPGIASWFSGLPLRIIQVLGTIGEQLLNAGSWIVDKIAEALPGIADWFKGLPLRIIQVLGTIGEQLLNAGGSIVDQIAEALPGIADWFKGLPLRIIALIPTIAQGLLSVGREIGEWIVLNFGDIVDWFLGLPGRVIALIPQMAARLVQFGGDIAGEIVEGVGDILDFILTLPGEFIGMIPELAVELARFGREVAGEIFGGITSFFTDNPITDAITGGGELSVGEAFEFMLPSLNLTAWSETATEDVEAGLRNALAGVDISDADFASIASQVVTGFREGAIDSGDDIVDVIERVIGDSLVMTDAGPDIESFAEGFGSGLSDRIDSVADRLLAPQLRSLPSALASEAGETAPTAMATPGKDLIDGLKSAINTALVSIRILMFGLALQFVKWLGDLSRVFLAQGRLLIEGLRKGMFERTPQIVDFLRDMRTGFTRNLGDTSIVFIAAGRRLIEGLRRGMFERLPLVVAFLRDTRTLIVNGFASADGWLIGAGLSLVNGLSLGIALGRDNLRRQLSGVGSDIRSSIGDLSNVLVSEGEQLIAGLQRGMRNAIGRLEVRAIAALEFAQGGIVPGQGPQMAIVHGGELILNALQQRALGGVMQWQGVAMQALRYTNQSISWLGDLLEQMRRESGGNPNAINLWDINARRGVPSRGLMQVIPPTFAAYAGELFARGIYDPFANIVAAIRYTIDRYGSLGAWRARGFRGYAEGGIVPGPLGRPQLAMVHGGEEVLTPEQRRERGNVIFQQGAISVTFTGAVPTEEQAYMVGTTVGRGIYDEVQRRKIRTWVRTS